MAAEGIRGPLVGAMPFHSADYRKRLEKTRSRRIAQLLTTMIACGFDIDRDLFHKR
jgi:hypothetical protein